MFETELFSIHIATCYIYWFNLVNEGKVMQKFLTLHIFQPIN